MTQGIATPTGEVKPSLNKYGYNAVARHISQVIFIVALLLLGAGTTNWDWAWALGAVLLIGWSILSGVLMRQNPGLLNYRGQRARSMQGTKRWDWVVLTLYFILLLGQPFVAGLDYRYGWSAPASPLVHLIGLGLVAFSFVPLTWSMAVNRHFEGTVRIQADREHRVVSSGPYRYVRHPGYVAVVLQFIGLPLAVGSWAGLIIGAGGLVLFIVRTALEDAALRRELPGYADFAQRTRYRLLPGVW